MSELTLKNLKSKVCLIAAAGLASGCVTTGTNGSAQQGAAPVDFRTAQPTYNETRAYASSSAPIYGAPQQQRQQPVQEIPPTQKPVQPNPAPYTGPFADPFAQTTPGPAPAEPTVQTAVLTIPPADVGAPIEVEPGDTLFALSERYRVALRSLIETNNLEPPFAIEAGQVLYLPPPNTHEVEPGENLYSISRRYNVDTRSLALMNGLPKPWTLHPGDILTLPALARDQGAEIYVEDKTPTTMRSSETKLAAIDDAFSAPKPNGSRQTAPRAFFAGTDAPGAFNWPLQGEVIKGFNPTSAGGRNTGVKIAAKKGAPIRAAASGEVVYAGDQLTGFGNLVLVSHSGGWVSAYAHADSLSVEEGQKVSKGDVIGAVGVSGSVDSPQLHFELRRGKTPKDPQKHLPPMKTA